MVNPKACNQTHLWRMYTHSCLRRRMQRVEQCICLGFPYQTVKETSSLPHSISALIRVLHTRRMWVAMIFPLIMLCTLDFAHRTSQSPLSFFRGLAKYEVQNTELGGLQHGETGETQLKSYSQINEMFQNNRIMRRVEFTSIECFLS